MGRGTTQCEARVHQPDPCDGATPQAAVRGCLETGQLRGLMYTRKDVCLIKFPGVESSVIL